MVNFWTLFFHEWRLLLREPRFLLFLFLPTILLFGIRIFYAEGFNAIPSDFAGFMFLILGTVNATMTLPFTADSFAGEKERNTLELLQLSPVSAKSIFFSKLFTILPFAVLGSLISQIAFYLFSPNLSLEIFLKAAVFGISVALLFNGISLMISLHSKNVRSATQLSAFVSLPVLFLVQGFYTEYFKSPFLAIVLFFVSIAFLFVASGFSLKKFKQL